MPSCCAVGCTNTRDKGFRLFHLPNGKNNEERRKLWLRNIRRADFHDTKYTQLCETHFEYNQFENNRADGLRKLKPNAVPTIFSHRPSDRKGRRVKKLLSTSPWVVRIATNNAQPQTNNLLSAEEADVKPILSDINLTNASLHVDQVLNGSAPGSVSKSGQHPACLAPNALSPVILSPLVFLPDQVPTPNSADTKALEELKIKIDSLKKQVSRLTQEKDNMVQKISSVFNKDQLNALMYRKSKGCHWLDTTVETSIKIRFMCGSKGYNYLRQIGYPLPAQKTLQRYIKGKKSPNEDSVNDSLSFERDECNVFPNESNLEKTLESNS